MPEPAGEYGGMIVRYNIGHPAEPHPSPHLTSHLAAVLTALGGAVPAFGTAAPSATARICLRRSQTALAGDTTPVAIHIATVGGMPAGRSF